jgi:hypothetical protein
VVLMMTGTRLLDLIDGIGAVIVCCNARQHGILLLFGNISRFRVLSAHQITSAYRGTENTLIVQDCRVKGSRLPCHASQ